jgi:hypothetical protein
MKIHELLTEDDSHMLGTCVMLALSDSSGEQLKSWCREQNIPCIDSLHLHLTILYSRHPMPQLDSMNGNHVHVAAKVQDWIKLGDRCLCLHLDCDLATKFHNSLIKQGGTHDFPGYIAHCTINYDWCVATLPKLLPSFDLVFDRIIVEPLDGNFDTPPSR